MSQATSDTSSPPLKDVLISQKPASRMADLPARLVSGLVMIVAALTVTKWGGEYFTLFWLAASIAVLWEWQRMIGGARLRARWILGAVFLVLACVLVKSLMPATAIALLVFSAAVLTLIAEQGKKIWSALGLLYAGGLLIAVLVLRLSLLWGYEALLWLFAIVWGTDIMAYFAGRLIGGPKLWPRISPSKTWSGFLIGTLCGACAGWLVVQIWLSPVEMSSLVLLAMGWATGIIAQGGDLAESSMKRHFGVKDSSQLIPGHGGFMDRLDGFTVAAIFAASLGSLHHGSFMAAYGLLNW
jgi:phosphatidate cytidylyltransferase